MRKIFNLDNPVWRFIGNLADFFLLSVYWYICALLIIPFGAGTTAMHSVTMKMAENTEGYTTSGFIEAFKKNFKQGTTIGILYLSAGAVIGIDFLWIFFGQPEIGVYFVPFGIVVGLIYILFGSFIFPLLAHYDNDTKSLIKIGVVYTFRNFLPIFSYTLLVIGIFSFGVFVFWPVLLVAPGLGAYISAFIINRIFDKYDMSAGSCRSAL